jgi:hypothetical protein
MSTRRDDRTEIVFVGDSCDHRLTEYEVPIIEQGCGNMVERSNLMAMDTYACAQPYIGWAADDIVSRSHGWDIQILQRLYDGVPLVYVNDLQHDGRKASTVFMPRRVVDALGYLVAPWAEHLYIDDAWVRLSERLNGKYLNHIILEHMHPYAKKAEWDDLYRQYNTPELDSKDGTAYRNWIENGGLDADVRRVQQYLQS